jgi:putative glutamine amidotransferase
LIGVTTSEVRFAARVEQTPQSDPPRREMALGLTYLRAIEAAGGLPVVMPPLELDAIEPLLGRLSGICLSGGPDLDPETYAERPHPELGPIEPALDRFELELARRADARGLPILAICRGMQALNVARGGSLYQHLPDRPGVAIDHRQREPGDQSVHDVSVAPGTRLAGLMGRRSAAVNSFHHQAVHRIGNGLRAVCWSPDGVIEGVEAPARDFVVGVQWHAESLVGRREQANLFRGLVDASTRFEDGVAGSVAA